MMGFDFNGNYISIDNEFLLEKFGKKQDKNRGEAAIEDMAEAIKLDISNNSNKIPQVYSGDFKLITQETDKFQLLKIKEKAFRYSGL